MQGKSYFNDGTIRSLSAAFSRVSLFLAKQIRTNFCLFFSCMKAETGITPTPYSLANRKVKSTSDSSEMAE